MNPFFDIEEIQEVTGDRGKPKGSGLFVDHPQQQRRPIQPNVQKYPSISKLEGADNVTRPPSTTPTVLTRRAKWPRQQAVANTQKRARGVNQETQRQETQSQIIVAIPFDAENAFANNLGLASDNDSLREAVIDLS